MPRILHEETSEYPIIMEERTGDHHRQLPTTADNATPTASNEHGGSQSAAPATNSARGGHKVLRLPRILHVNKQVNALNTMQGRTGDQGRRPKGRSCLRRIDRS